MQGHDREIFVKDIEEFGLTHEAWLRRLLRLPNGIPSHETI